jgi:hypothetical protein
VCDGNADRKFHQDRRDADSELGDDENQYGECGNAEFRALRECCRGEAGEQSDYTNNSVELVNIGALCAPKGETR